MPKLFLNGLSIGATDQINLSNSTQSIDITNLSHFDLQIQGANFGIKILPAYSTKPYKSNPGEQLEFSLLQSTLNPVAQSNEYIQLVESDFAYESGITPLALIPVYTTEVNITNGSVPVSGNLNANITNAEIPVSGSVTINNANLPITGNVGITSGNVNATIQNASLDSNVLNASLSTNPLVTLIASYKETLTNIANGSSVVFSVDVPLGIYDEIFFVIESSGGLSYYSGNTTYVRMWQLYLNSFNFKAQDGLIIPILTLNTWLSGLTEIGKTGNTVEDYYAYNLTAPLMFNSITLKLYNGSGAVASDVVTIYAFGKNATGSTYKVDDTSKNMKTIYTGTQGTQVNPNNYTETGFMDVSQYRYISAVAELAPKTSGQVINSVTGSITEDVSGSQIQSTVTLSSSPTIVYGSPNALLYWGRIATNYTGSVDVRINNTTSLYAVVNKFIVYGWRQ